MAVIERRELELAPFHAGKVVYDMGLRRECTEADRRQLSDFYGRAVYARRKRQLNSKEIKRLALRRDQCA